MDCGTAQSASVLDPLTLALQTLEELRRELEREREQRHIAEENVARLKEVIDNDSKLKCSESIRQYEKSLGQDGLGSRDTKPIMVDVAIQTEDCISGASWYLGSNTTTEKVHNNELYIGGNADLGDAKDIDTTCSLSAQSIADIATSELNNSGVVFDKSTGMYYDWSTGYYYDPTSQMYYHPTYRAYYRYDRTKSEYVFHAYAHDKPIEMDEERERKREESSEEEVIKDEQAIDKSGLDANSIQEKILCVRLVVKSSEVLKEGTVYVIGQNGGTIGREKDMNHVIQIGALAASKNHARISYMPAKDMFNIVDLGSKNGTYVEGKRLIGITEKDDIGPTELVHGHELELGKTVFCIHIHRGSEYCVNCALPMEEQELQRLNEEQSKLSKLHNGNTIIAAPIKHSPQPPVELLTLTQNSKVAKETARRKELNSMKRTYGLMKPPDAITVPLNDKYSDRAAERRTNFPKGDPTDTFDYHKPVVSSSIHVPISEHNLGSKLLRKMGWEGGGLGKQGSGKVEPVVIQLRPDKLGLGAVTEVTQKNA